MTPSKTNTQFVMAVQYSTTHLMFKKALGKVLSH